MEKKTYTPMMTQYLKVKEPEINRTAVKDDLKAGKEIEGVMLDRTRGLRIRWKLEL